MDVKYVTWNSFCIYLIIASFIKEIYSSCKYLHFWSKCIWVKVFRNGPSKICGRQPLKNLK